MKQHLQAVQSVACIPALYRIMKLTAFLMTFMALQVFAENPAYLQQQPVTINGTVTDEKGEPLPGVSVIITGTTRGTVTDINGRFELEVPDRNQTLQFSFVGMVTQEVPVGNQTTINVTMMADYIGLQDVVVVGYGTQNKANLTGSMAVVNVDNLKVNPKARVTESLQGLAAGVDVYNSNVPGQDAKIRIHGFGTIGNNDPLWVVDGIPGGRTLNLNPADIESITILKDAASTAIYGARGSNGVILVTTKKGKQNTAPQIDFNVRTGFAKNYAKMDLLNPHEYGEMLWLQAQNDGIQPNHPQYGNGTQPVIPVYVLPAGADQANESLYDKNNYQITKANPEGTDWYDLLYRTAALREANLSVTGGGDRVTYGVGLGYISEEGIVKYSKYDRFSFNTNVVSQVTDWLEIGTTNRIGFSNFWGTRDQGESGPAAGIATVPTILPAYDIMGNFAPVSQITAFDARVNPLGEIYRDRNRHSEVLELVGNVYSNISIAKKLNFKPLFGYILDQDRLVYPLENNYESFQPRGADQLTESLSEYKQFNFTNTLNYTTSFSDKHSFQAMVGTETIWRNGRSFSALRNTYFSTDLDYMILDAGEGLRNNSGSAYDWSLVSFFGRVNYGFDNKYLLDATFRRDGSSRFGAENPWGNFASVGAAWRVSEESFMSGTSNWLDDLKFRVSWGQSGNDNIGNYNGYSTYHSNILNTYYPIKGGNVLTSGFALLTFGNPMTKWETTVSKTIGIDASLFNQLAIALDLWQKDTQDMLYQEVIPSVMGNGRAPSVNVGDMRNRGVDVQLTYKSQSNKDFNYTLTLNLTHYRNEIVRLSSRDDERLIGSSYRQFQIVQSEKGQPFPSFFGYDVQGLFQSQDEASAYLPQFGGVYNKAGQFKYRDVNGDGEINGDDRTFIGNPHPDLIAGLVANISYKRFQIQANFYSTIGNDMVNLMRRTTDMNFFLSNRSKRRLYESWGSPYLQDNKDAKMPIAQVNDSYSQVPSTYYIEDGSYLRLRNLQVGYELSDYIKKLFRINRFLLYANVTDLFTITDYTGLDPSVNTSDSDYGVDLGNWPAPRRYMLGINMSF